MYAVTVIMKQLDSTKRISSPINMQILHICRLAVAGPAEPHKEPDSSNDKCIKSPTGWDLQV